MVAWRRTIILLSVPLILSIPSFVRFASEVVDMAGSGCGKADAIVVITGGHGRIEQAMGLFRSGMARYLILSGGDASVGLKEIFFMEIWKGKGLPEGIILEKRSTSTFGNAIETEAIAMSLGIKSLILVTSLYHMKRALYTFRRIMPGTRICGYTVESSNFKKEWWKDRRSLYILITEFVKFQWYRLYIELSLTGTPSPDEGRGPFIPRKTGQAPG